MLASLIAVALCTQTKLSAVVVTSPRLVGMDADEWERAKLRAEAVAEGSLRQRGYRIESPAGLPEFKPQSLEEAKSFLQSALQAKSSQVAIGIRVVRWKIDLATDDPEPVERQVTWSGRPVPKKTERKKNKAGVTLQVWLLEEGQDKLFIDGRTPVGCAEDWCGPERLLSDASGAAMTDVLRRFLCVRT